MKPHKSIALILMLATSLSGAVFSQELPDKSALAQRLGVALPSYWKVDDFTIIAQAQEGSIRTPLSVIRYEASIYNSAPLYKDSNQSIGPFAVVVPTVDQNTRRTLYGIMELSYKAGVWTGTVDIENPVVQLGRPTDFFADPVVVLGTERAVQLQELLATSEITALLISLENEIAQTRLEQGKRIADLQIEHEANLVRIEQSQAREIEILRAGNVPELEQLRSQVDAAIENLEQEYQIELSELQKSHAENLAEVQAEQAGEIRNLEVGFNIRIESLKTQINESQELTALQERFMRVLEDQAANYVRIGELHSNVLQEKADVMRNYLGQWTGSISCTNRNQWQIRFVADKVEGQSVSGTWNFSGTSMGAMPAVLNFQTSGLSRPIPISLTPEDPDSYKYLGEIGEDGFLRARSTRSNCELILSQ